MNNQKSQWFLLFSWLWQTYLTERTKFHQGLSLKVSLQPWSFREQQRLCWTDLCTPQLLTNKRIALPRALFSSLCDLYKSQRWVHFTHFECQIQKPCKLATLSLKGELIGCFFPPNRISIAPYGHNGNRILMRLEINEQNFFLPWRHSLIVQLTHQVLPRH